MERQTMQNIDTFIPNKQPEFPKQDLTDENVEMLAILLGNRTVAVKAHTIAECANVALKFAHPAVVNAASLCTDDAHVQAVNYGNILFEGATSMVAQTEHSSMADMASAKLAINTLFCPGDDVFVSLSDTIDEFKEQLPNTAEFIKETSGRFFRHLTAYALAGAALERAVVLNAGDIRETNWPR